MNKYSSHAQTALDDGHKADKLATDYFLEVYTAQQNSTDKWTRKTTPTGDVQKA